MPTTFNPTIWRETVAMPSAEDRLLYVWLCHNKRIHISGLYAVEFGDIIADTGLTSEAVFRTMTLLAGSGMAVADDGLVFVPRIPVDQHLWSRTAWPQIVARTREAHGSRLSIYGRPNGAYLAWCQWVDRHRPVQYPNTNTRHRPPRHPSTVGGIDNPHPIPTVHPAPLQHPARSGVLAAPTDDKKRHEHDTEATMQYPEQQYPPPSFTIDYNNSSSDQEGGVGGGSAVGVRDNAPTSRGRRPQAEAPEGSFLPSSAPVGGFFRPEGADGRPVAFQPPTEAQIEMVMRAYLQRRWATYAHFAAIDVALEVTRFVDHYTATGWKRTRGIPLTDWIQAAERWMRVWPQHNRDAWRAFQAGRTARPTAVAREDVREAASDRAAADAPQDPVAAWERIKAATYDTAENETETPTSEGQIL